ncbi:hypothetical protein TNCV_2266901 [Trichonephila clavipes]|nr:hypothetical protein TNCV_2266901 [Trichonephila clavipes]
MYKDTKNFVRSCTVCLSRKNAFKIPPAPHQPVEQKQEPGETCHIDIFGPLKTTPKDIEFDNFFVGFENVEDDQHASATCSPPVGATGWPSSRIVEGLQLMTSFKDWRELMCSVFSSYGTFIVEGLQWMISFKDWKELTCSVFLLMGHL